MKRMVLLLGCLLLGGLFLSGCSNQEAPFAEKAYTPEGTVRAIHLDVQDRAVEVVRSQDAQVHIQYAENSKEYYEISVSDDQVLTMTSASDKAWTDYVGENPLTRTGGLCCRSRRGSWKPLPCPPPTKISRFRPCR